MKALTTTRRDFRFFLDNAGYIVGRRAEGALALARAEAYAYSQDWQCVTEWDDCEPNCEVLILSDVNGEVLTSLGGVDVAFDSDARRVFWAELAAEAMERIPAATFGIGKAA